METSRIILIILLVLFILFAPDGRRSTSPEQQKLQTLVELRRHALGLLNSSRQGDFDPSHDRWLNVTGLRRDDGYAWDLLPMVRQRAREQAKDVLETAWIETAPNIVKSHKPGDFGSRYSSVDKLDGEAQDASLAVRAIPFFQNVTGLVHGTWRRSLPIPPHHTPSLNLSRLSDSPYSTTDFSHNVTGAEGDLFIKLDEKSSGAFRSPSGIVREISADMTVQDESAYGDGWQMKLYGIHFPESGAVLLTTTSEKFAGISALPHLARSQTQFELTHKLLSQALALAVDNEERLGSTNAFPWSSSSRTSDFSASAPSCEYVVYLQQNLVWPFVGQGLPPVATPLLGQLESLESELRAPTGLPTDWIPKLQFSAVIFSPDCGFVLESKGPPDYAAPASEHLQGFKAEVHYTQIRRLLELFSILVAGQIYLLMKQMKDASTPSTRSRISYYTIAIMALGDGFIFLVFMALSLFMDAVFLTIVAFSFLSFLSVSFFGMKFLMDVWSAQAPERLERERQRERDVTSRRAATTAPTTGPSPPAPPAVVITPAGADTLPLPATAPRLVDSGATPIVILPPDQDIEADAAENDGPAANAAPGAQTNNNPTGPGSARREMGTLYSKFYFLLVGVLFLSLNATTWPTILRAIYARTLATCYLSFWWPQIRRNTLRNCRRALRWDFVLGQSSLRLLPFAYFTLVPHNILFLPPDYPTFAFLGAWVWLQILLLASQDTLGPRFFLPHGWAPPAYDYHPVLREDEEEAVIVGGAKAAEHDPDSPVVEGVITAPERGKRLFDCAICMQAFEVPVLPKGSPESEARSSALGASLFGRRAYMVTPCRHVFHSACLEGWMRYKLQCPICRESLPPL